MNNSTATMQSFADPAIEVEIVSKALEQVSHPVTARQLRDRLTGPFKLPEARLAQLLEQQVSAGRIHRFAARARSGQPRYWSRTLEDYARELLLSLLAARPYTQSELLRSLKTRLSGYSVEKQRGLLARLVKEKQIHQLPGLIGSRTVRFSVEPVDPREYILDAVVKIGKKLGVAPDEILKLTHTLTPAQANKAARPQNEQNEKLLTRMVQVKLAAAQGGLVPLSDLWRSLKTEGWDKTSFDRTVLNLAANYRVSLHRHNFPSSLSEEDRAELVADELGNIYVGIALR